MTGLAARGSLALAFVALSGMPAAAQSTDALHLECVGPFGPDGSETGLRQIFGDGSVAAEVIDGPEGSTLDATLLFPDDPTRRLVILWQDEASRAKPAAIIIRDDSEWVGPGGLRLIQRGAWGRGGWRDGRGRGSGCLVAGSRGSRGGGGRSGGRGRFVVALPPESERSTGDDHQGQDAHEHQGHGGLPAHGGGFAFGGHLSGAR